MTELEQILFVLVDFYEIRKFSKIAVFKDFGGHFEICVRSTILVSGPNFFVCLKDTHIFGFNHCLGHYPIFWGPTLRNSNLR